MTGLLVSVRNVDEAKAALMGGADIIDIKEPANGPLGAASLQTMWQIYDFVDGRAPVSAACGELCDESSLVPEDLPPLAFVKIGLSGCQHVPDWRERLNAFWGQLPPTTEAVGVAYANWRSAYAISPDTVLQFCVEQRVGYLLMDTTDKSKCLMSFVDAQQVKRWQRVASRNGMRIVVAGSLNESFFSSILPLWRPAYVGVRGAACTGGRLSRISRSRVASLSKQLREVSASISVLQHGVSEDEKRSEVSEIS